MDEKKNVEAVIPGEGEPDQKSDIMMNLPISPEMGTSSSSPSSPRSIAKRIPKEKSYSIRQQNAEKLLLEFAKTFITVMESTVWAKSDSDLNGDEEEDGDEFFDHFGNDGSFCKIGMKMGSTWPCLRHQGQSQNQLSQHLLPLSDEEFAFEKYFPLNKKEELRSLFISLGLDIFRSYEYQLIMLVRERRKISEIAEDIVHRILDNFKESQRGFNPEFIKPDITRQFLIEQALQHSEPEGITYNSEWSAVEILENPGILVRAKDQDEDDDDDEEKVEGNHNFYQSHWQKNFIGVKKKIGSKYGFRLKFDFETEKSILNHFEKVPNSSVSPLYLNYEYCLGTESFNSCKAKLFGQLEQMDASKNDTVSETDNQEEEEESTSSSRDKDNKKRIKDKVKEFQLKLQIQKLEEEKNSDKVMKQVVNLSRRFDNLTSKLVQLEEKGVIERSSGGGGESEGAFDSDTSSEITKAKSRLLKCNYNVRFEVRD